MHTVRLLITLLLSLPLCLPAQSGISDYGHWQQDGNGLPAFQLDFHRQQCPWYPFNHTMSTGANMVVTNQWGDVHLLTTESGQKNLTPALWYTRGGFYPTLTVDGELVSLLYTELDSATTITYGVGYTRFSGISTKSDYPLQVDYTIITPLDFSRGFYGQLRVTNLSARPLSATLTVSTDVWVRPGSNNVKTFASALGEGETLHGLGIAGFLQPFAGFEDIVLLGSAAYTGSHTNQTLSLQKQIDLPGGETVDDLFRLTYNTEDHARATQHLSDLSASALQQSWVDEVRRADFGVDEDWIDRETVWNYSQLLSFSFYDKSLGEYFINLGGYGIGDVNTPTNNFSMREIAETAIILANFNPALAASSLRWMAKTQTRGGDLLRSYDHRELKQLPEDQLLQDDFPNESDTEIWFLMAVAEYVNTTDDRDFLNERIDYMNRGVSGTMWEHAKAAFRFIRDDLGTGERGLIRMLDGDWNDYLSKTGEEGNGQSVMNTGMMCKALLGSITIAEQLNDPVAEEMRAYLQQLQEAVGRTFDRGWFVRAYDDHNQPVGGYDEQRLFLNAQSWAVLGQCGTPEQRKLALENALERNTTPIGLMLMSRPYSSPTPENISWAPIPAGEGENAGIWPQTVGWFIWALAEEGMTEAALEEWKKSTLHSHTLHHPEVPFGVYNGPDCYSSKFAHEREGWTQQAMFDRMNQLPMLPIVAWQPFGLKKILAHRP